jgi:hypothetical protein
VSKSTGELEQFLAAGPWPQRTLLRALLPLARRPRGLALLGWVFPADQAIGGVAAMGHYDRPEVARALGWDADAVVARGRELRRTEGRP